VIPLEVTHLFGPRISLDIGQLRLQRNQSRRPYARKHYRVVSLHAPVICEIQDICPALALPERSCPDPSSGIEPDFRLLLTSIAKTYNLAATKVFRGTIFTSWFSSLKVQLDVFTIDQTNKPACMGVALEQPTRAGLSRKLRRLENSTPRVSKLMANVIQHRRWMVCATRPILFITPKDLSCNSIPAAAGHRFTFFDQRV